MLKVYKSFVFFYLLFISIKFGMSGRKEEVDPYEKRLKERNVKYSYADPDSWKDEYPLCGIGQQSPIGISDEFSMRAIEICPSIIYHKWDRKPRGMLIGNDGHGVFILPDYFKNPFVISGNSLFEGFHKIHSYSLHWSNDFINGSEHSFLGFSGAAEVHALHLHSTYRSLEEAAQNDNGILIITNVYIQGGTPEESALKPLREYLPWIRDINDTTTMDPIPLNNLVFPCQSYFFYNGSLTHPPCYNKVGWLICMESSYVSEEDLNLLREIKLYDNVNHNIRPLQDARNVKMVNVDCD